MKRPGCTAEYEDGRNRELIKVYRELVGKKAVINLKEIWEEMAGTPASRFYVSEERAAAVVRHIMAGGNISGMNATRRSMFMEIHRRVKEMRGKRPGMTLADMCAEIVLQPAPCFYLTPASIRVIVYRIRRGWYGSREKR